MPGCDTAEYVAAGVLSHIAAPIQPRALSIVGLHEEHSMSPVFILRAARPFVHDGGRGVPRRRAKGASTIACLGLRPLEGSEGVSPVDVAVVASETAEVVKAVSESPPVQRID